MKFKNPSSKNFTETATVIAGLVAGAIVSRAVIGLIHTPSTDASKDEKMLLAKRGVIIVGSGYGASAISGTDTISVLTKSAMQGMAGMQTIDGITDLASKSPALADTSTKLKKGIASGLGLKCPSCTTSSPALWGSRRRRKSLNVYVPTSDEPIQVLGKVTNYY
jgi:hypothetical protein